MCVNSKTAAANTQYSPCCFFLWNVKRRFLKRCFEVWKSLTSRTNLILNVFDHSWRALTLNMNNCGWMIEILNVLGLVLNINQSGLGCMAYGQRGQMFCERVYYPVVCPTHWLCIIWALWWQRRGVTWRACKEKGESWRKAVKKTKKQAVINSSFTLLHIGMQILLEGRLEEVRSYPFKASVIYCVFP